VPRRGLAPGRQQDVDLILSSELFDERFYLAQDPDLDGLDPAVHYYLHGAGSGLDPSASFSSSSYLERYADVSAARLNPLVHYLRSGRDEGRSTDPLGDDVALVQESGLFDQEYYRHFHPDVADEQSAIAHYLRQETAEGVDPSERFSSSGYLRLNPDIGQENPLLHYIRHGLEEGRATVDAPPGGPFATLYRKRWPDLQPFPVSRAWDGGPRVTVLTDSVGAESFFGGVGTALILGVQLANAIGGSLRLATRHAPPDPGVLGPLQRAAGVLLRGQLEVAFPEAGAEPLALGPRELLLTTSWWTTRAALDSGLRRDEVVYLVQEDERMFYPYGDDRLLCGETLAEPGLPVVVNTRRLLDHLLLDFPHLDQTGLSFEPAFPGARDATPVRSDDGRRRFFFYARPGNPRNLYWRGGRALSRAIEAGVLDPDVWSFHFVGRGTPSLSLPRGVRPEVVEGLAWNDYQALVAGMDAGLTLMDTPHPSYPPYDLAAAGAAVLTNRHPGKEDLSGISRNILVADASEAGLLDGLAAVAALGQDDALRRRNLEGDSIERDWERALATTVDALHARLS
jgi:hypothetical protein